MSFTVGTTELSTSAKVSVLDLKLSKRLFGVAGNDLEPKLAVSQSLSNIFNRAASAICLDSLSEL